MGFVLAQEERDRLIQNDPKNAERIFAYLGGQELNTSPGPHIARYVISFDQMSLEEAAQWPALLSIVREKVKPERNKLRDNPDGRRRKERWWLFGRWTSALNAATADLDRCLVTALTGKHRCFTFVNTDIILDQSIVVFATDSFSTFSVMSSRVHARWADLLSSSMKSDIRYIAGDAFETFPFPAGNPCSAIPELEGLGRRLYETRSTFMSETNQGLTKTYNALKDPAIHAPRIVELRQLHIELDQAVLAAYAEHTADRSWLDIEPPPYTDPQAPAEKALHQAFEDEILDHLFALNEQRANR
jgi:hypothetical protein